MAGRRLLMVWIAAQFVVGLVVLATAETSTGGVAPTTASTITSTPEATVQPTVQPTATTARPQYPLTGRVVLHDGRPLADAKVVLVLDDGLLGALGAVLDAGFGGCRAPDVCNRGRDVRTDRSGRFEFVVTADPAQKEVLVIVERAYSATATSTLRTTLTGGRQDVGTIPLWEPKVTFSTKGASWSPAPPNGAKGNLVLTQDEDNSLTVEGDANGVRYDARLLEDFTLEGRVVAHNDRLHIVSPPVQVRGPGRPPSRSRPCVVSDPGPPTSRPDCPWTTGRIRLVPATGAQPPEGMVVDVDLGVQQPLAYLIVRGSANVKEVQISPDRSTWQPVQMANDFYGPPYTGYSLTASTAARWVRIRWATFGVNGLDGLSLWT